MQGELDLAFVVGIFTLSLVMFICLGLFFITVAMKARKKERKRIARVSGRGFSGKLAFEEARLNLAKKRSENNGVIDILARVFPVLDSVQLQQNIVRANLNLNMTRFIAWCLGVAAVLMVLGLLSGGIQPVILIPGSLVLGMLITDGVIKYLGKRMTDRFMRELPLALDTIIRGVRSGIPVGECIATIGREYDEPIGGHFRAISERVQLGETLDSAIWGVASIIRRPEMDFMAVCISIQMETGGSLAEALGNLADLLRKRQQMKLKVKAISSEAKASAMIIGALPFVMLTMLSVTAPDYVAPLFNDPRGNMALMGGGFSIAVGAFVMWRMTQFEI
ncbi:type II secretion system F family protein [Amaricoccus tamworthensis]|uniref:type II secretion system F family protein n=1 Tax=Amaricoccus tamworthensis TaxID=57002 RepID=UPI003C7B4C1A